MSPIPDNCNPCSGGGGGSDCCPVVQTITEYTEGLVIDLSLGNIVLYDGPPDSALIVPPWTANTVFEIHNDTNSVNVDDEIYISSAGDAFQTEGGSFQFGGPFSLPPGYAIRLTAIEAGIWDIEQIHIARLIPGLQILPALPYPAQRINIRYATVGVNDYYAEAIYSGISFGWDVVGFGQAQNNTSSSFTVTTSVYNNVSPSINISLLLSGVFDVSYRAEFNVTEVGSQGGIRLAPTAPGVPASDVGSAYESTFGASPAGSAAVSGTRSGQRRIVTNTTGLLQLQAKRTSAAVTGNVTGYSMVVVPVRFQ